MLTLYTAQEQEWFIPNYFIQSENHILVEQTILSLELKHHVINQGHNSTDFPPCPWIFWNWETWIKLASVGSVWERVGKTWCLTCSPRNHYLPWHGTKGWNSNTRDFFPCEYFVLLVNLFSHLYSFKIGPLRSSVAWWFWWWGRTEESSQNLRAVQKKMGRCWIPTLLRLDIAWGQPWVVVELFCCLLQGFALKHEGMLFFFYIHGESRFQHSSFSNFTFEGDSHSLLSC